MLSNINEYLNSTAMDNPIKIGMVEIKKFSDEEISINLLESVRGKKVFLLIAPNNSDTTFNIEYGLLGFSLGTGTSALVTGDTTYTLSGLNVSSLYEVYVQTLCGSDSSYWRGPTSFATACGTVSAPYFTNLDSGFPICWTQDSTDSFDWRLNANGTPSFPTGPSDDVTGGGNYMYIETSFPVTTGDSALLHSVDIDLSSLTNPSLSFYSHMYGSSIGELSVWITSASGATNQVFVKNGNQGDQWNSEYVPLSGYTGVVQFTILAVASDDGAGNTLWGDIAIDNFEVSEAPSCPQVTNFGVFNISTNTAMTSWLPSSSNNSLWHVYLVPDTIPGSVIVPDSSHLIVSTNDTLSLTGLDFITSISGAATSISNVGPGLGPIIGPNGDFSSLPDISKWILTIGMILGRLELFAILVLFLPSFWRN